MKNIKYLITLVVALSIVMMSVSTAKAGGPSGGWASGISCQNLDSANDAVVILTFYAEGQSTEAASYNATITKGTSKNWLTTSMVSMPNFPTAFSGSAVVSSSTALACNVNTQSTGVGTVSSPYRIGTNSGFNDAQISPVMFIPQVLKGAGNYNSYISVQNTTAASVTVKVHYYLSNGSEIGAAVQTAIIPGQSSKVFYQSDNAGLPAGFNGGAKVESTSPADAKLAVTVALYKDGASYATSQFLSYNGAPSGANKVFVPRFVRKVVGNNSGLTVQNVGNVATTVTVVFNFNGTEYTVHSPAATPVAPGASWLIYAPSTPELSSVVGLQGSAVVTADTGTASLIAIVNEDNNDPAQGTRYGQGSTYNAVPDGQQSNSVFFAQFTKRAANVFSSGFQISNTTNNAGTCDISYPGQTSPNIDETGVTLPANGSINRWALSGVDQSMLKMNNGYNAAVKVTCTQPVTGIVNMAAYGAYYGDSFTQTGGLNQ